jgi:hypothetical protein
MKNKDSVYIIYADFVSIKGNRLFIKKPLTMVLNDKVTAENQNGQAIDLKDLRYGELIEIHLNPLVVNEISKIFVVSDTKKPNNALNLDIEL